MNSSIAMMETNKGTLEIELYPDKAPITVKNFKKYVEKDFYDGLVFHRVIKDFFIQAGAFHADGAYKEPIRSPIKSEADNGLKNRKGTIAMARTSEPHTATSQFFINTVDNEGLDHPYPDGHGYAVFGRVAKGKEVIKEIASTPTGEKDTPYGAVPNWPQEDTIITKAYLKES